MSIHFRCSCGELYEVDDAFEGESARCMACGRSVAVLNLPPLGSSAGSPPPKPNLVLTALILLIQVGLAVGLAYYLESTGKLDQIGLYQPTNNPFMIRIALASCFFLCCLIYPLTLPTMLARRRHLSLVRWLIVGVLAALLAATSFLVSTIALSLKQFGIEWHQAIPIIGGCLMTIGCFGSLGSLIAAVFYPKTRT